MNVELPQDDVDKIAEALYAGRKIEAVKLYRAASGHDLKTAVDFVNQIEARLRAESPEKFTASANSSSGCGILALIVICLVAGTIFFFASKKPNNGPQGAPAVMANQGKVQPTVITNASDPATPVDPAQEAGPPFEADLAGHWQMLLPSQFESHVELVRMDANHYRLNSAGVMNGEYQLLGKRLVMDKPIDDQQIGQWKFRWQIQDADHLLLIGEPNPRTYVGATYLGATLIKNVP